MSKYLTEARQLARMDKQRVIVNVRDYFEDNGTAYIVMEYINGITFTDLVREMGGRIPEEKLFPIVEPLFGALCTLHQYDLIHRDMCPDNLMLEVRDQVVDCVQDENHAGAILCEPFKACHKIDDLITIPKTILEIDSTYKLYLRHYWKYCGTDTVLFAI